MVSIPDYLSEPENNISDDDSSDGRQSVQQRRQQQSQSQPEPQQENREPQKPQQQQQQLPRKVVPFFYPLKPWDDEDAEQNFGPSWNSHGVVHVRLLRAKHLPCPVGSSVCAVVSLPPYKGRVRTKRKSAFSPSLDDGVCVQWGKDSKMRDGEQQQQQLHDNDDFVDNDGENPDDDDGLVEIMDSDHDDDDDEDGLCSMVNGWSSDDSPVPSIQIDLMFSPLGLALFDFTMASIELSCAILMKNSGLWRTRWCTLNVPESLQPGSGVDSYDRTNKQHHYRPPVIQIRAIFVPTLPTNNNGGMAVTIPVSPSSSLSKTPRMLRNSNDNPPVSSFLMETKNTAEEKSESDGLIKLDVNEQLGIPALAVENKDCMKRVEDSKRLRGDDFQIPSPVEGGDDFDNDDDDLQSIHVDEHDDEFRSHHDSGTVSAVPFQQGQDEASIASKTTQTAGVFDPHFLRSETYWVPATCAVCSRVLFGRNGGFHCEKCEIDCCSDCRLNVDLRVPCGSDLAQDIVANSLQSKISISNLLAVVAPDEAFEQKKIMEGSIHNLSEEPPKSSSRAPTGVSMTRSPAGSGAAMSSLLNEGAEGIGRFCLDINSACIFQHMLPAWNDVASFDSSSKKPAVRKGDYYARVSTTDNNKTLRTPTLQNTGMPKFQSVDMNFPLSHYGSQFRIDVVDANTETVVGSALLTTQGILQEQRDLYISKHGASIFQFLHGPIRWVGKRKLKVELRSGIKSRSSNDYFSLPAKPSTSKELNDQVGSICGWVEVNVGVEEFTDKLYGPDPIRCANRPPPDLNMTNFSVHVARLKAIVDDIKVAVVQINYLTSWKNPALTAFSLYVFVTFCLSFNAEYSGSLPFLFLLVIAVYCAIRRSQGRTKDRYIMREIESIQRVEGGSVGYTVHRPIGIVSVSVSRGRDLISRDLGIAGKVSCRVFWDGTRYAEDTERKDIIAADKSAEVPLEIGSTPTLYTTNPDWNEMLESTATKRLKQLIPSAESDFFQSSSETYYSEKVMDLSFPVLQPFDLTGQHKDVKGRLVDGTLQPWESSKGAIVMQIIFQDFLNNLPGFDHTLGEVVFPFSELIANGEINGWFQIVDVGSMMIIPLDAADVDEETICGISQTVPRIYLHLKWTPPVPTFETVQYNDSERETSVAVQEELVRSSTLFKEQTFDLVGSSIGAVNTALGIGGTVQGIQNTLGSILDVVEALINAFNFTDPFKSSIIVGVIFLLWFVLILIPTRFLVLVAGLAQYGIAFFERFGEDLGLKVKKVPSVDVPRRVEPQRMERMDRAMSQELSKPSPVATWISNAILSLPTNEDLRKAYFWESRRVGARQVEKLASEKRTARLEKLWKASWYSSVKIFIQFQDREGGIDQNQSTTYYRLEPSFAMVQGHRFLWWHTVQDFDDGELPAGKLLLSGHAGWGGPSPIEMKIISNDELPLCLSIFGRGGDGQERVTMLLPDASTKDAFEVAVTDASTFKRD